MDKYKPVIGLEIHIELKTNAKMFCNCSANYFEKAPNTNVCPVCLGMPGALPVPNKQAIEWTVLIGKALNCKINEYSKFDRKHYFYPDLPKGYQISQYDMPIAVLGELSGFKITRVHLEEDTGKLIHNDKETLINFNRSSVPLVEIVTEPVFDNSSDVKKFLEDLQTTIKYLGVSECDMEKGSMRLEPNISLMEKTAVKLPNYKVEVKNINSFNFVKQAIDYELNRQLAILQEGKTPIQETRGYDEKTQKTYSQRSKENAQDYRYFPEPDIPPMKFSKTDVDEIVKDMPELPHEKEERYIANFAIRKSDAYILTRSKEVSIFFEKVLQKIKSSKLDIEISKNIEQNIANIIVNKKLATNIAVEEYVKKAIEILTPKKTDLNLLTEKIAEVLKNNSKAVEEYKKGKINVIMFLLGQVMREMKGQADASIIKKELEEKLKN